MREMQKEKPIICVILKKEMKKIKINNNLKFKSIHTHKSHDMIVNIV